MSTPLSLIAQGSFISTGAIRAIELPQEPCYFMVRNRSLWGTAPTAVVQSEWFKGYANGQATTLTEGGASAITATAIAAGGTGFTFFNLTDQSTGPLINTPGTAITAANPAVASDGVTPAVGDIVRLFNTTGMLQIAGLDFTVTAVTPGVSYTLGYLDASTWAAPATNVIYRRIPPKYYSPYRRWITGITQAVNAVITVSVAHNYLVGDKIRVIVPPQFGMTQLNGQLATVTAVTASTMTIDINTLAYTAFAYPTSAVAAAGVSFPHIVPVGEVATKLTSSMDNVGYYAMLLDTGVVGANTNVMDWMAFARDYTF